MKWVSERDLYPSEQKRSPGTPDLAGGGVRLFCLPHAGSGAAGFYRWKRMLPGVAVCPVMLPGREARLGEPLMTGVGEIVEALHAELRGELRRPYAIFGHSMSALIAFEWARRIEADGLPGPMVLFASGRVAPCVELGHRKLHTLGDEEMVRELVAKYGGDAGMVLEDADLREVFLPILRADLTVVESYRFVSGMKLKCRVRGFAGETDGSVSGSGLEAWGGLTAGGFAWRRFAGDKFYQLGLGLGELLGEIGRELVAG